MCVCLLGLVRTDNVTRVPLCSDTLGATHTHKKHAGKICLCVQYSKCCVVFFSFVVLIRWGDGTVASATYLMCINCCTWTRGLFDSGAEVVHTFSAFEGRETDGRTGRTTAVRRVCVFCCCFCCLCILGTHIRIIAVIPDLLEERNGHTAHKLP